MAHPLLAWPPHIHRTHNLGNQICPLHHSFFFDAPILVQNFIDYLHRAWLEEISLDDDSTAYAITFVMYSVSFNHDADDFFNVLPSQIFHVSGDPQVLRGESSVRVGLWARHLREGDFAHREPDNVPKL